MKVRVGVAWGSGAATCADGALWRVADALEEIGYDSLWLSDTAGLGGVAPLPALASVAARTERLKLGTAVLVLPPRNPVLLARELATVDLLSGGRLLPAGGLGLGVPQELEAMGVPRGERVGRLEESVAIIKALWPGEPVTRRGRFWSLTDVQLTPVPHRRNLEFWLGGSARPALERIGRIADGWLGSFIGPAAFGRGVEIIREAAAGAGRSIDEDHYGTTIHAVRSPAELSPAAAALLALAPAELAREDHVAFGSAEVGALLERFIAAGATKFVLVPTADDPIAWLEQLFVEVVQPLERAGAPSRG